ncbi:hypothetical protein ACTFIN_08380 [Clostridium cagae]|uniref:hypothetical protein n=1 Tax=Clostridium cagae TaxID=2080751 RepID=UPI003F771151
MTIIGYDAYVHVDKRKYSRASVEYLLEMMEYKKYGSTFYCGNDEEYKYHSGIKVWKCDENDSEIIYRVRTMIWASGYDIKKQNDTIRCLKKYCSAWFESDEGKDRYFKTGSLIKGAESGCYLSIQNLDNSFAQLSMALNKYPEDTEAEKQISELGLPMPSCFNANVYLTFLCSVIEEYFRSTYIALLKYSDRKEKILNVKFSPYDMVDISLQNKTVEDAYARTLSFQNIQKIISNFKQLNSKLDISKPLKEPYHRRKNNFYEQIDRIFERRHGMIHRMDIDLEYTTADLIKDIEDVKVSLVRVYEYICKQYNWEIQEISI